jgi:hypothetical protein
LLSGRQNPIPDQQLALNFLQAITEIGRPKKEFEPTFLVDISAYLACMGARRIESEKEQQVESTVEAGEEKQEVVLGRAFHRMRSRRCRRLLAGFLPSSIQQLHLKSWHTLLLPSPHSWA